MSYHTNPAFIAGYLESALTGPPGHLENAVYGLVRDIYTDLGMDEHLAAFLAAQPSPPSAAPGRLAAQPSGPAAQAAPGRQEMPSGSSAAPGRQEMPSGPSPAAPKSKRLPLTKAQHIALHEIATGKNRWRSHHERVIKSLVRLGYICDEWLMMPGNDYPTLVYGLTDLGRQALHQRGWKVAV